MAAEVAIRDRSRRHYIVRSSSLLAASDLMGNRYELKVKSTDDLLTALERIGASAVVVARGAAISTLFAPKVGKLMQRLELRTEDHTASASCVVQRLLAEPVTTQRQFALFGIPERERKHPDEAGHRTLETPRLDGGENNLRVAAAAERVAKTNELTSSVAETPTLRAASVNEMESTLERPLPDQAAVGC
jgi:hypothetical protein